MRRADVIHRSVSADKSLMPPGDPDRLSVFLTGQGSFALSLLVGAIVIALYGRKRIEEFSAPPKGEEYDFTKMLSMDTIVGETIFYKSYFYYVLFLEFLYFFVCTSKPLVLLLTGDKSGATFEGAAWPLGAALVVVGLLPSTPVVAQIEAMLRGLAQRVASIPGDFYERVSKLSRSEIENLVAAAPDYKPELKRFWRIYNQLVSLGFATDDARLMARSCISAELFGQWTLQGSRIWNTEEFDKYRDIVSVLRPKTELLRKETEALLVSSQKIGFVGEIWQRLGITDPTTILSDQVLDAIVDEADRAIKAMPDMPTTEQEIREANLIKAAVEGWKKLAAESEMAAKRLSALFAIIARNDRRTVRELRRPKKGRLPPVAGAPDPVVAALVQLLEASYETQAWSNAAIIASATGTFFCIIILALYLHGVDAALALQIPLGEASFEFRSVTKNIVDAFRGVETTSILKDSLFSSFTLFASFTLTSLVALFLRSVKIDDGDWIFFGRFRQFPLSNYYMIILWGCLASFMPSVISLILYYYRPGEGDIGLLSTKTPAAIVEALGFRFLLGFTAVTYAIGTCIIADIVDAGIKADNKVVKHTALCLRLTVIIIFVQTICLIANPIYALHPKPFWHNLVAAALFSYVSLRSFLFSYEAYAKG